MRRYLLLLILCLCGGCSLLAANVSLTAPEEKMAADLLTGIFAGQKSCPRRLDLDVSLTYRELLVSGTISGYLQAMAPSFLRFEGVNPLGLTELIFSEDGERFTLLNVRERKGYTGPVAAARLTKYLPEGVDLTNTFPLLMGCIPMESMEISNIKRSRDGADYWAEIRSHDRPWKGRIRYSSLNGLIRQWVMVGGHGEELVSFSYEYEAAINDRPGFAYLAGSVFPLPQRLIIHGKGGGVLTVTVKKNYADPQFGREDFVLDIPAGFTKETVQ